MRQYQQQSSTQPTGRGGVRSWRIEKKRESSENNARVPAKAYQSLLAKSLPPPDTARDGSTAAKKRETAAAAAATAEAVDATAVAPGVLGESEQTGGVAGCCGRRSVEPSEEASLRRGSESDNLGGRAAKPKATGIARAGRAIEAWL